jgi:hypothetical protein
MLDTFHTLQPDDVLQMFPSSLKIKLDHTVRHGFEISVEGVAVEVFQETIQPYAFRFSHPANGLVKPLHEGTFVVILEKG